MLIGLSPIYLTEQLVCGLTLTHNAIVILNNYTLYWFSHFCNATRHGAIQFVLYSRMFRILNLFAKLPIRHISNGQEIIEFLTQKRQHIQTVLTFWIIHYSFENLKKKNKMFFFHSLGFINKSIVLCKLLCRINFSGWAIKWCQTVSNEVCFLFAHTVLKQQLQHNQNLNWRKRSFPVNFTFWTLIIIINVVCQQYFSWSKFISSTHSSGQKKIYI